MKIIALLFCMLIGFCFACKDTFDIRDQVAQRQQLLATATIHTTPQPQAISVL